MRSRLIKKDFTLGAIYRLGAKRRFMRETLVRLVVTRAHMKQNCAEQLVGHWLTTEPFRNPAQ